MMKYVFFGSPRFATIILERLIAAGMPPAALVCNPDRPVGRKHVITPPPAKTTVRESAPQAKILQPETLDDAFIAELRAIGADVAIVAAYSKIIPQRVIDIPARGTLGTHPSLLPKYRGASPIQSALLAGETTTGATIYAMDAKMDHGPIVAQRELAIAADEDYPALEEKLATLSAELLIESAPPFVQGRASAHAQDESRATFTKKFSTEDGFVDDDALSAAQEGRQDPAPIYRKIRALNPEPGAWTLRNGIRVKILRAAIENNALRLLVIQEEGQRPKNLETL